MTGDRRWATPDELLLTIHDHPNQDTIALRIFSAHPFTSQTLARLTDGGLIRRLDGSWCTTPSGVARLESLK